MRRPILAAAVLLAATPALLAPASEEPARGIRGFSDAAAERQRALESRFRSIPDAEAIRRWHRFFTAEPHPATSPRTEAIARFIAETWREQGLEDVRIRRYDVLSSNPVEVRVEMVAPEHYVPSLREDPYPEDPDTASPAISGAWISFSASGETTAPVVYANSGNPEDYEELRRHGIDPRGKIVVVRYSNPYSYRGFKALTAEREGAAAMIVYSDPAEDGYVQGEVYPKGPWGPESHFQRGGIAYDFIVPGDPLTPGWASTPGARRIPVDEALSVPKIMAVPMSYRDIRPILERLGGPRAPEAWQGGLPIDYRLGGEAVRLHMKVVMDTSVKPNFVVEGRIRGAEEPDSWIVLGNHHDAWVFGGVDPSSGTASLMEVARALGALKNEGVRPRRTLVFCAWDGEEVTLTGSTEWGEEHAGFLERSLVAYLNVDSSSSGSSLRVSAVGSLAPMIVELAREIPDPAGGSLYDRWRRRRPAPHVPEGALLDEALVRTRIGSGTDHTVFLNYLGRPVVDMTFEGPYGVYHSAYDDHFWVSRIGDPGFRYHRAMALLWGSMALRLANAEILPYDFDAYAGAIRDFVAEVDAMDGADELDLGGLVEAVRRMRAAARRLDVRIERLLARGTPEPELARRVNEKLLAVEGAFLDPSGIPGRPWFKHLLYAPKYTYAAMVLPGIAEALERGDRAAAREEAALVEAAVRRATTLLDAAARDLEAVAPDPASLEAKLRRLREDFDGRMGIYVEELDTGETVAIDGDGLYETFSVIKVPVLAEAFRQAERGRWSLDERIRLRAEDRRIPSGVLYALDPGLRPTVRDLLTLMIIVSDNEATDVVADRVGRENVTAFMKSLGLARTEIAFSDLDWDRLWLGRLDPDYATASGDATIGFPFDRYPARRVDEAFRWVVEESALYFGRSTPREMGRLFAMLGRRELVSAAASETMLGILGRQQVRTRFPRYLGEGIRIAHKTGDGAPFVGNDAGILWIDGRGIVLVCFTGHHRGTTEELNDAVARVAAVVAQHYGGRVLLPETP